MSVVVLQGKNHIPTSLTISGRNIQYRFRELREEYNNFGNILASVPDP
jgi:hypothetical protein